MSGDTTEDLQGLIDRLLRGDDAARSVLLERAYQRLRRIASSMFHRDFPGLRDRHDLESVVDESWARLMRALQTARPPTVEDFLRLVATQGPACPARHGGTAEAGRRPDARARRQ